LRPLIPSQAIDWAETKYESVYGTIFFRWEKKNGKIQVNAVIPPNSTAVLAIPGSKEKKLGSGEYSFVYENGKIVNE
jgi:alpha-L-rhamnosidase